MQGKKWASVEDAGILLCTKSPDKVDCLKYNTEYRKLMKLQQDLAEEGITVDFWMEMQILGSKCAKNNWQVI